MQGLVQARGDQARPLTELPTLAYVDIDDFFENKQSRYKRLFDDKIVFDADELTQQNRTVWFVRPTKPGDKSYKVSLLDSHQLSPSDFSQYESSQSSNILWVSDLHFGEHHAFPRSPTPSQSTLATSIANAAEKHRITDFSGIIVSGDISWKAALDEFAAAKAFLDAMSSHPSGLSSYRIAICPGNHDLAFNPAPDDKTARVVDDVASEKARGEYETFYERLFYKRPNKFLAMGRRLLVGGGIPVEIACLNSSYLQQSKGWFQGHGFIGNEQLKFVAEEFGWTRRPHDSPRPFRIAVLHHHLLPVSYREIPVGGYGYSVVLDAEAVVQWIVEHQIDLVLHGHMHAPFCARVSRPSDGRPRAGVPWHEFHVVGMGSTGVAADHRKEQKNMFGVLKFGHTHLHIRVLTVAPTDETSEEWALNIPLRTAQS